MENGIELEAQRKDDHSRLSVVVKRASLASYEAMEESGEGPRHSPSRTLATCVHRCAMSLKLEQDSQLI